MPIFTSENISGERTLSADALVIGSGAGGAVTAHELAKAGLKVIVLEKGPYHITSDFKSDPRWATENLYAFNGVTASLGFPPILIPFGECVGGTTVINSGTVFRIPPELLEQWGREHRVEEGSADRLAPFYAYIEEKIGARESVWPALGELNRLIDTGAKKLGFRGGPLVRNAPDCAGCGVCVFGCPAGAKRSMLVTFVPAADALGVEIYANARVDRIKTESGRATGAEATVVDRASGQVRARLTVNAKVVVLAAGAFGSPTLLQANALADRSGEVGRNLWIHPAGGAVGKLPQDVEGWKGIPQGYHVSEWAGQGIMLEGGFGPPEVISLIVPGFGAEYQARMAEYKRMLSFGVMIADRDSTGSVTHLKGRPPLIRYQLGKDDTRRLAYGWGKVMEILFAAGAEEVYSSIHGVGVLKSAAEAARLSPEAVRPHDLTLSAYHPMGTCRMGADPKRSVVDSYLESHDVKRLFIADASVFPSSLGVNPQASIMAFAARTADYLVRNRARYF